MVENRPVLTGIEAVFIDLDDTLWDFTASSAVALRHVYDTYCIERWSGAYDVFRDLYKAKNKELWDRYHYGKIEKTFLVFGTGADMSSTVNFYCKFIGTVRRSNRWAFHIFEVNNTNR